MIRLVLAGVLLFIFTIPANATPYHVPATADLYLAGQPQDRVLDWGGGGGYDTVEKNAAFETKYPLKPGVSLTITADGEVFYDQVYCCRACFPLIAPDGLSHQLTHLIAEDGHRFGSSGLEEHVLHFPLSLSGYKYVPRCALIGVFTADVVPALGTQSFLPAALDFGPDDITLEFYRLKPMLNQVFFIGNGETSDGTTQYFIVPEGAKRLFLGINDCPGAYFDNIGAFDVQVLDTDEQYVPHYRTSGCCGQ
jgi:hypothetical protein